MFKHLNPPGVPAPAFYSQAVEATGVQRLVFVSGQVGVKADGAMAEGITEQTKVAIANLKAVLAQAKMDVSHVAKYTIYMTDPSHFDGFVAGAAELLSNPPAATTLLYVKALAAPNMLIEIEAVAAA